MEQCAGILALLCGSAYRFGTVFPCKDKKLGYANEIELTHEYSSVEHYSPDEKRLPRKSFGMPDNLDWQCLWRR
jgi:hypothetical protein